MMVLECIFFLFFHLHVILSASQSCMEYKATSVNNYYSVSSHYYYKCGWLNLGVCKGTYYYLTAYVTYVSKLSCCEGHGGSNCLPICSNDCGQNMQCTGPDVCSCISGWTGYNCLTDIDECANGNQLCEVQDLCNNTNGTYTCSCNSPDILAINGHRCLNQVYIEAVPFPRSINLSWLPSDDHLQDGQFLHYNISCIPNDTISDKETEREILSIEGLLVMNTSTEIYPLSPFIDYTCCVTMEWMNDSGPPNCTTTETLQDAPDGPPENIEVFSIDSSNIFIQWQPPSIPNGFIVSYTLYIDYTNYSKIHHQEVDGDVRSFLLNFLYAYQLVGVSLSATTEGGEGPSSSFQYNRTLETIPHAVHNLNVEVLSSSRVNITWNPPKVLSGIITMYHIELKNLSSNETLYQWAKNSDDSLYIIVSDLEPFIRYRIEISAATVVGKGIVSPYNFYTVESVPIDSPTIILAVRLSAVDIFCQWNELTLPVLRGFITYYTVKYTEKCSDIYYYESTINITETSITLTNLNPHNVYCIKVAAATSQGLGKYSNLSHVNPFQSSLFELSIFGLYDCKDWIKKNITAKIGDVKEELTKVVSQNCNCELGLSYIQLNLLCDIRTNDRFVVQGNIVGTSTTSSNSLLNELKQWVNTSDNGQVVVIQGYQLYIDPSCGIVNATMCDISIASGQTSISSTTAALLGAIISIIVTGIILTTCLSLFMLCLNSKGRRNPTFIQRQDALKFSSSHVCAVNPVYAE